MSIINKIHSKENEEKNNGRETKITLCSKKNIYKINFLQFK